MRNIDSLKKEPFTPNESLENRMDSIEMTLGTFQSSVLEILGAIREDMSEMMRQPRYLYSGTEDESYDSNMLNDLLPLNTMDKFNDFEINLTETTFKENFVSSAKFSKQFKNIFL